MKDRRVKEYPLKLAKMIIEECRERRKYTGVGSRKRKAIAQEVPRWMELSTEVFWRTLYFTSTQELNSMVEACKKNKTSLRDHIKTVGILRGL